MKDTATPGATVHPDNIATLFEHARTPRDWSWQAELAWYLHLAAWLEDCTHDARYFGTRAAQCKHLNDLDFAREILGGGFGAEVLKANWEARDTERRRAAMVVVRSRPPRKPKTRLIDHYAAAVLPPPPQ